MVLTEFEKWLATCRKTNGDPLSNRTIEHYSGGVKTVSEEMLKQKVISKRLEDMNLSELERAIFRIFQDKNFIAKNTTGKEMYSNALKKFRSFIYFNEGGYSSEDEEVEKINKNPAFTKTEKETLIKARVGQGTYRNQLIKKFNGTCIVTGLQLKQVLTASHIKPWCVCNNSERVDVENGLLLSATYDRLFDSGLISFDKKGQMMISSIIPAHDANILQLKPNAIFNIGYNNNMDKYIEYHNKYIFSK